MPYEFLFVRYFDDAVYIFTPLAMYLYLNFFPAYSTSMCNTS